MSREYDDNQTLQQKIMKGADVLADMWHLLLTTRKKRASKKKIRTHYHKGWRHCCHFVALKDPIENAAAKSLSAAVQTNADAGDGTTTATVLAAILRESQRFIASGVPHRTTREASDCSR